MLLQGCKASLGLFDRWLGAGGNPPEHCKRLIFMAKPGGALPIDLGMVAAERVSEEGVDIFPDAEVDQDAVVVADAYGCAVTVGGLVTPYEPGRLFSKPVDAIEIRAEVVIHGAGEGLDAPGDVVLGKVVGHQPSVYFP